MRKLIGSALSAEAAVTDVIDCSTYDKIRITLLWTGGVTAGQVTVEASPVADYGGTWAQIGQGNAAAGAAASVPGAVTGTLGHAFVRARISTAVADGTVDIWFEGQNKKKKRTR